MTRRRTATTPTSTKSEDDEAAAATRSTVANGGEDSPGRSGVPEAIRAERQGFPSAAGLDAQVLLGELRREMFGRTDAVRVGRFRLEGLLGRGAHGNVYLATDAHLKRRVALKLLARSGPTARARLLREAQALAQLKHPNVLTVHDVGVESERVFIATEYVEGGTLAQWSQEHPPGARAWFGEVLSLALGVARGLAAAHEAGIVHRDVKPANILVGSDGRPRLADFGLAAAEFEGTVDGTLRGTSSSTLTRSGRLVGTPAYMAPEQFEGRGDALSDQFGLCVVLWELAYSQRPFAGETLATLARAVNDPPRPPPAGRTAVPGWWRDVLIRGLAPDPAARWPSVAALASALERAAARRRRRLTLGLAVTFVAATTTPLWMAGDADPQLCSRAQDELARVWDDERRDAVRAGLLGTEVSYASGVWAHEAPKLDEWTRNWVEMHTGACEATRRGGEQSEAVMDMRMACLYRARQRLHAVANVLSEATPQVVQNAHEVVAGLPRLSRCANVEALRQDVPPPEPKDADAVAAVRGELAEAIARREAGDSEAALAAVRRAEALLDDVGYEPLRAEVALQLGFVLDALGEYASAEAALRRARRWAAQWKQRDVLRDATVKLVYVLGVSQERHAEALALREVAEGLSVDIAQEEARARNNVALVLAAQGGNEEAESEHRAALALMREALGDHPEVAIMRDNLGLVLAAQGRYEEAEWEHRAALELILETLGAQHPSLARTRSNLATTLLERGNYAEAESEYRAALALALSTLGADHPIVAGLRNNLATALHKQANYREAESEFRAVLNLTAKTNGDDVTIATLRANLAGVLRDQGRFEESESEHRVALALMLEALGDDHPNVAQLRNNLAIVLNQQGKYEEAEAEHRAVLALRRDKLGVDHPHVAESRSNLGVSLLRQGKYEEAESELRAALALRLRVFGADHPKVATVRTWLAAALRQQGETDEAREILERAWSGHERIALPDKAAATVAFDLAQLLWAAKTERDRALALARQALEWRRKAPTPDDAAVRDVEQWLQSPSLRSHASAG